MYNLCPHCQNPIDLAVWALKERDRAEGEATTAKTHEEIAKDNEEKAKTNEAEAKKNAAETRRILGEFSVANGLRELKEGNFGLVQPPAVSGGAVLWVRMPILTELVRIGILTHRPAPPCVEPGLVFMPGPCGRGTLPGRMVPAQGLDREVLPSFLDWQRFPLQ